MSKIYLTEGQINAAIYKAINEAFGVGMNGQFISDRAGWGPRFTSFAEDAKKFATPEDAQDYIDTNLGDDFGASVVSIPSADDVDMDEMNMLRESIRKIVRESLNEMNVSQFMAPQMIGGDMGEAKKKPGGPMSQKDLYAHLRNLEKKEKSGQKVKRHRPGSGKDKRATKRSIVINWLKKSSVNDAAIMRMLWHPSPDEEDAKRSEFYKKRDGAINKQSGARYSFTDEEINQLYTIKSNGV